LQALNYIRIELEHAGETSREIHVKNLPEYMDF
jgi:hypothetical protein